MYKQIKFSTPDPSIGEPDEILGGIGIFDDEDNLIEVICGCCGCTFEACDVKVLHVYHNWVDLVDTIIGDDKEEDE